MAKKTITELSDASNLNGASVPIVQGGDTKEAGISLFDARYQGASANLTALAAVTPGATGLSMLAAGSAVAGRAALSLGALATGDDSNDVNYEVDAPAQSPFSFNIYASTLRQKLEWDTLTAWDFLNATQRADTLDNDCWEELQNFADFLLAQISDKYGKTMKLGGLLPYRVSQAIVFEGLEDRNGYVTMVDGTLIAEDSWAAQTTWAKPMIHFTTDSARCGLRNVKLDCNGVCSGVLVEPNLQAQQIRLQDLTVWNFHNPSYPNQAALFSNCVDVTIGGQTSSLSSIAVKRYWNAHGHKRPFGIRIGPEDPTVIDTNSSSCIMEGLDIRNWDRDRTEGEEFRNYTGVGLWVASSDCQLRSAKTFRGNLTCIHVEHGSNNEFSGFHLSPYGNFATNYKPDSTIQIAAIENGATGTKFVDGYHECIFWATKPSGLISNVRFPRGTEFVDGNLAAITIDAPEAAYTFESDDGLLVQGCKFSNRYLPSNSRTMVAFRESGGFTFDGGFPDMAQLVDNNADFFIGTRHIANLDSATAIVEQLHSGFAGRCMLAYWHQDSTVKVQIGAGQDTFLVRGDNVNWLSATATYVDLIQSQELRIGGNAFVSITGIGYGSNGGTVTQSTSKSTTVVLNKPCGQIVTDNAALADGAKVQFQLSNSLITQHDMVRVWRKSGGTNGHYRIDVDRVDTGLAVVRIENISGAGSQSDALTLGFIIFKAVIA